MLYLVSKSGLIIQSQPWGCIEYGTRWKESLLNQCTGNRQTYTGTFTSWVRPFDSVIRFWLANTSVAHDPLTHGVPFGIYMI